jgi:uroporphyrinogen-III decarboxylase
MSFQDGWAAINLEMPKRVPRTEYSAEGHWDLIKAVTGIAVTADSPKEVRTNASNLFRSPKHWNYDFFWSVMVSAGDLGKWRTDMGHAVYAAGGADYNTKIQCPFADPEDVLAFDPLTQLPHEDHASIVNRFNERYRNNVKSHPDGVNMTGIYITCVSGLIDMFGWEMLLLAMGTDPVRFGHVANRYAAWIQRYFDALAESEAPVVMVHDDIVWTEGPIFPPAWYREYVFPHYHRYFKPLRDSGKKIMFTSDANYTTFVDDIVSAGVHGFVMEPTTDMKYVAERYGRTHVFIGNADTRILLSGPKAAIRREVERCMTIGKPYPGFFMAVGNHIPSNTPVENAVYYNEVYESLSKR